LTFVCDNWSALEKPDMKAILDKLKLLTHGQFRIEALSMATESLAVSSNMKVKYLCGGLDTNEWKEWQTKLHYGKLAAPGQQQEKDKQKQELKEIEELTGLIPLYLQYFQADHGTFELAKTKFMKDINCGMGSLYTHLEDKLNDALRVDKARALQVMASCLSERPQAGRPPFKFYSQLYFYYDEETEALIPISLYVRKAAAVVYHEVLKQQYLDSLDASWVSSGLNSKNASVKGFAFEEYCLGRIAHDVKILECKNVVAGDVKVELFDTPPSQLSLDKRGWTLWWPSKWNYRQDAVLRGKDISAAKADGTEKKRARVGCDLLIAIQVTLESPQSHKKSLDFFSAGVDYKRWSSASDANIERIFVWMVPSTQVNKNQPAHPGGVNFAQRVISVEV